MPTRVIEIDQNQMQDAGTLPIGMPMTLSVMGKVLESRDGKALIAIESILPGQSTPEDSLSNLVSINQQMLRELRQLPKVKPYGET